jgi:hypothetical protein
MIERGKFTLKTRVLMMLEALIVNRSHVLNTHILSLSLSLSLQSSSSLFLIFSTTVHLLMRLVFCADLTQSQLELPPKERATTPLIPQPSPSPLIISASSEPVISLQLLVHCPNYWTGCGDNRDSYLPNPAATSTREIQMFEFLGKLMGIALRTKEVVVDIDFPPLIWKSLLAIKPDRTDLAVNSTYYNSFHLSQTQTHTLSLVLPFLLILSLFYL